MKTIWLLAMILSSGGFTTVVSASRTQDDSKDKPAAQKSAEQEKDDGQPADETAQEEADEDLSKLSSEDALAKVKLLGDQFNEQLAEYRKNFQAASAEEKVKLRGTMPQPAKFIGKFQKIAELFPETEAAGQALLWIVQHQRTGAAYEQALATLLEDHAELAELKPIVAMLQYQQPSEKTTQTFENLMANAKSRDLQAVANYAYLQYQKRAAQTKKMLSENPDRAKAIENANGKAQLEYLQNFEPMTDEERLAALEKLSSEFGDVEIASGRKLATAIEGELFEAKYLQIGMVGPDIEGEDIDGTPFKLSDYRGKVVVLDFWGDW